MAEQALADALEHLVRGIVDHPERVRVDARGGARGEVLEVRVHPDDLGRVIGRGGRTASSLRTVVASLAAGERIRVDVVDTDDAGDADELVDATEPASSGSDA
ncbi:RNA-binding protein [Leucobacter luti]|uniref:RNA-binding protein KhpA n=1 Tax=Leucobacter luti TaxID=340320 RepID=A0A4Q7TWY3_9MICO|nr:RNA-binding protein [Leucobacter luti]MBL3698129.1 RNA-binding protein [Leucobacter luti]RZT64787.1 RNA-binding protein with KH domain [Leucobacter luti]